MFFIHPTYNQKFIIGSLQHILPITLGVILGTAIIYFAKNRCKLKRQHQLFNGLGVFVSLSTVLYHLHLVSKGNYNVITDLPLFICSFISLFIFVFTYYRKYWVYEILLFWIIAGTTHGVITPDIPNAFPDLDFFRYWIVHLGLIIIILYASFVLKMRPTLKSVFKSFLALQLYMVILFGINALLGSNYSYLNEKPVSASILDYLGGWPSYIIVIEVLLIPYFLVIYFPFYISEQVKKKTT